MTRAAIVGTGFIARVHARALRSLGVEIAAVCGRTDEGARAFGTGQPYTDLHTLLDAEPIDVLHVCTPNDLHADQALAALESGIHVVCEKPLTVAMPEARALVAAAASRGLVGATCYHARGYPLVEQMRADRADGRIGDVAFVHGCYLCDDIQYPALGWRVDPAKSGAAYVVGDLGTHWLDLAEHVTGKKIAAVLADFRSFSGGPLEDYASLLLRFDDGTPGSVVISAAAGGRRNQLRFECEGSEAGLTWDQEEPNVLLVRPLTGPPQRVVKDPSTNAPSAQTMSRYPAGHGEGYGGAFENIFREVYRAVAGEEHAPFPTFADGLRGVALVEAAVASARGGGWVEVERA